MRHIYTFWVRPFFFFRVRLVTYVFNLNASLRKYTITTITPTTIQKSRRRRKKSKKNTIEKIISTDRMTSREFNGAQQYTHYKWNVSKHVFPWVRARRPSAMCLIKIYKYIREYTRTRHVDKILLLCMRVFCVCVFVTRITYYTKIVIFHYHIHNTQCTVYTQIGMSLSHRIMTHNDLGVFILMGNFFSF